MMDIRMVASDIDGTILPSGGKISEATKAAVAALRAKGIDFVISSGRWFISARRVALEAGITEGYMIIASGGAVVDMGGNPLKEWFIPPEEARRAYEIMKKYNVLINSFVRGALYQVNTAAMPNHARDIREYYGEFCRITDDWEIFEEKGLEHVYKLEAYCMDPELLNEVRQALLKEGFLISGSHWSNFEINGKGIGKGTALKWLADSKGISMENVMAFGDNSNDMDMLTSVGWPVAVGNAIDEAKAAARIVCENCEDNGVAKAIIKYVFGEEETC